MLDKQKQGAKQDRRTLKRKFGTVIDLQRKIDAYFKDVQQKATLPTVSGLTLFLGFASTSSTYEYLQSPKYGLTIKKAMLQIQNVLETRLIEGKPPIGLIFALKNRFDWQDKKDIDLTSNGETLGVIALPQR